MIKPIFTEKTLMQAKNGKYTFKVDVSYTKFKIKDEISKLFDVTVTQVRTSNIKSEKKKNNRGVKVLVKGYKKAVVMLGKDQKLDIFEVKEK